MLKLGVWLYQIIILVTEHQELVIGMQITENGEMQVQDIGQGIPGYDQFPIHLLGGVVFYTSIEELYGYDSRPGIESIAAGFHRLANLNMPVTAIFIG